ncbi:hypothetical protein EG861_14550, partial [Enterococcus faecalis]
MQRAVREHVAPDHGAQHGREALEARGRAPVAVVGRHVGAQRVVPVLGGRHQKVERDDGGADAVAAEAAPALVEGQPRLLQVAVVLAGRRG